MMTLKGRNSVALPLFSFVKPKQGKGLNKKKK